MQWSEASFFFFFFFNVYLKVEEEREEKTPNKVCLNKWIVYRENLANNYLCRVMCNVYCACVCVVLFLRKVLV